MHRTASVARKNSGKHRGKVEFPKGLAAATLAAVLSLGVSTAHAFADERFTFESGTAVAATDTLPVFISAGWSPNHYLGFELASMSLALDNAPDRSASALAAGVHVSLPFTKNYQLFAKAGWSAWRYSEHFQDHQKLRENGNGHWGEVGFSWLPEDNFSGFIAVRSIGNIPQGQINSAGRAEIDGHSAHLDFLVGGRVAF